MTKQELVSAISKRAGLERAAVSDCIEGFMAEVMETMANGDNVYLRGFGSFIVKHCKEKTARNITKGTPIHIPAKEKPSFKPCNDFVERLNPKKD